MVKLHLKAIKDGYVEDSNLGVPVLIKRVPRLFDKSFRDSAIAASYEDDQDTDFTLVHEVKRVGFLIDRYVDLQLRIGDSLVLYLQRASA